MYPLYWLIDTILQLAFWAVLLAVLLRWLTSSGVVDSRQAFVASATDVLHRLTEPMLRPIRQHLPLLGGVDLSPLVLLILIGFLRRLVAGMLLPYPLLG